MITISLCMIVRDAEKELDECLSSAADLVDEIIIVDTGSSDNTVEIAKMHRAKIFFYEWIDNFSAARNFSFKRATMDYILWLDAGDIISDKDAAKLYSLKESLDPSIDVVLMKHKLGLDDNNQPKVIKNKARLFRQAANFRWREPVNEYVSYSGNVLETDIAITRYNIKDSGLRNIKIYEGILSEGEKLTPKGYLNYAKELRLHGMAKRALQFFNIFLTGEKGTREDNVEACIELSLCYERLGDEASQVRSLTRSMEYGPPNSRVCVMLGWYYENKGLLNDAIFWFETVFRLKPENLTDDDCYVANLHLSRCYEGLGDDMAAKVYDILARKNKAAASLSL